MANGGRLTLKEHEEWCRNQHEQVSRCLTKIDKRLASVETHTLTHAQCAEQVRTELKALNSWAQKRDGATKALMWVGIISGSIIGFMAFLWGLISNVK